jgi:hypothetical protein
VNRQVIIKVRGPFIMSASECVDDGDSLEITSDQKIVEIDDTIPLGAVRGRFLWRNNVLVAIQPSTRVRPA